MKVIPTNGGDDILMVSKLGQAIRFNEDDVRPMGRAAAGVRGMKMRAGDEVVSLDTVPRRRRHAHRHRRRLRQAHASSSTSTSRAAAARACGRIKLTAKKGHVVAAFMVELDDEIFVINSGGTVIRMAVREITQPGPRRHRRPGHGPRRGPDGRRRGPGAPGRRRPAEPNLCVTIPPERVEPRWSCHVLGLAVGVGGLGLVGTFGILSFLGMPLLVIGLALISAGVGPTSAHARETPPPAARASPFGSERRGAASPRTSGARSSPPWSSGEPGRRLLRDFSPIG